MPIDEKCFLAPDTFPQRVRLAELLLRVLRMLTLISLYRLFISYILYNSFYREENILIEKGWRIVWGKDGG